MAAFWAVLAMPFLFGDAILRAVQAGNARPAQLMGLGVIALGVLAARNPLRNASDSAAVVAQREAAAERLGNRLFVPALAIPGLTALFYFGAGRLSAHGINLLDPKALTLTSLGAASVFALAAALRVTRAPAQQPVSEGRRLLDALGWAVLLPMVLATLGGVFAATGVGSAIAAITSALIPVDSRMACLAAFALGMILFTVIMGNAFAAFPVMMAGIGLPLLVLRPARIGRARRNRHADGLLRHAADPDGRELQHRAGRAARPAGPVFGHPRADRNSAGSHARQLRIDGRARVPLNAARNVLIRNRRGLQRRTQQPLPSSCSASSTMNSPVSAYGSFTFTGSVE